MRMVLGKELPKIPVIQYPDHFSRVNNDNWAIAPMPRKYRGGPARLAQQARPGLAWPSWLPRGFSHEASCIAGRGVLDRAGRAGLRRGPGVSGLEVQFRQGVLL